MRVFQLVNLWSQEDTKKEELYQGAKNELKQLKSTTQCIELT